MDPLVLDNATKRYRSGRGIFGLSLQVRPGEVLGFLGPNGAGKTTTIRLVLDFIRPDSGDIRVFGRPPADPEARRSLGYLSGDLRLYMSMTGREHARFAAGLRGLPGLGAAPELAERLALDLDEPAGRLSRGNRQKLGIVLAMMHRPALLVLDEPTTGLDPLVQQTFHGLVADAAAAGAAVLVSSHVLPEIQHLADRVALIRDGRLVLVDSVDALRSRAFTRVEVTLDRPPAADAFAGVAGAQEVERHGATVLFALQGEIDPLVKRLAGHHVLAVDSHEADLEDVFLRLYQEESDAA
jgi:ABC-2 type transport system ATP-binding protein